MSARADLRTMVKAERNRLIIELACDLGIPVLLIAPVFCMTPFSVWRLLKEAGRKARPEQRFNMVIG